MPAYRSRTTTHGRNMAGARALWRATGMTNDDFGKPIVAIANCVKEFTTAMIGLPKSESFMPVARQRPRAPAMLRPWVVVRER